ncbi:MAG: HNH endonuclease [Candidatus Thermoplasmatota archaeon]|nr:HNH endonuclease [Candidatus Thermoplasmatota archaeon]
MNSVVVLNADYQYINNISWQKAVCLLYKDKAETVKKSDKTIYNESKTASFVIPVVIRLVKYIKQVYQNAIPYSKRGVFTRDHYICQYCGEELYQSNATIDHIVPKAKGGKTSWTNCTTSCKRCNNIKGDRDLHDTPFNLKSIPKRPKVSDYIRLKSKLIMDKIDIF